MTEHKFTFTARSSANLKAIFDGLLHGGVIDGWKYERPSRPHVTAESVGQGEQEWQLVWRLSHAQYVNGWDEENRDEPFQYVVTSRVSMSDRALRRGAETYIYPSDSAGKILNWSELPGSQRGEVGHEEVLDAYLKHINEGSK